MVGGQNHERSVRSHQVGNGFVGLDDAADVAVLIVSYNSAADLPGLFASLRREADHMRLRVILADNASTDRSVELAAAEDGVITLETGGNLGYAAGINVAASRVGEARMILVLNPDLTVRPGSIARMATRLDSTGAGIVVPRIVDSAGLTYTSLRREPTLTRALGDAFLGSSWLQRPEWLSEFVRQPSAYDTARRIDWATGAALLVSREAWQRIGPWDERFFLYSEETDFFRRIRDAGWDVWYEPEAVVEHRQGGSGSSNELIALLMINRVRYLQKHRPLTAGLHRAILIIHEELRRGDATHVQARKALWSRRRWADLPGPSGTRSTDPSDESLAQREQTSPMRADTGVRVAVSRSIVDGVGIDHVLVTRFNLPSPGPESLIRAQDGWLQNRIQLFERYTVPAVRAQTFGGRFDWIVYLDPQSPSWLRERLAPLIAEKVFTPVYRDVATWEHVVEDARATTGAAGEMLITTNLDNDDGLAIDFVQRVQMAARRGERAALYLADGLILSGDRCYLRADRENAFCSVAEPWDGAVSAWRDWHNMLGRHMPVRFERGRPGWLQVVHSRNVSNVVRGRLVDPANYVTDFPGVLDELPTPTGVALAADAVLRVPLRDGRDILRRTARSVLVRTVGKEGLDRVKSWAQRIRRPATQHATR
ncbi:glycosyltransferase [Microlunatus soli]|uniref:Glycosyltransferase, GT2 family n=1 Tax=Microlunatus soli TaxID=630515 RepID=A0A1H1SNX3_9ACTN|nr:glycosyltransferase [Microlunatus soli]SDS49694.1 Glycosyltransferase, GT2 family [Microlunatus soli]